LLILGKIIPNSPADQCGQLHINDRILAVNGIDLTHMLHTDVVNLIKESGRSIKLTIGPPIQHFDKDDRLIENQNSSNGIRPSSSSSMVASNGDHHTLRNAFSHNSINPLEKYFEIFFLFCFIKNIYFRNQNRPSSRTNGILKSVNNFCFLFFD